MKLDWIEDFLTLVDAGSFSRAAGLRNVTQPAFSRRIQMFEEWLGVELVNRRARGLELTPSAVRYEPVLRRLVSETYEMRSRLRADARSEPRIALTTQHTLMVSHLPKLLRFFKEHGRSAAFHVRTGNLEDCVAQLIRGEAELLLCFEVDGEPLGGHPVEDTERLVVGIERLIPVSARDERGGPIFDPSNGGAIPLLSYPEESFLGRVVRQQCLPDVVRAHTIETVCESAFSVGIKEMALAGMGIAWLPHGLIERELDNGTLLALHDHLGSPALTICAYRMAGPHDESFEGIWSTLDREPPAL